MCHCFNTGYCIGPSSQPSPIAYLICCKYTLLSLNAECYLADFCVQLVSAGDVVQGHVTDKSPRELSIQVTSFVGTHKHRELSDIEIKVR